MCDMLKLARADIDGAIFYMGRTDDEVYLNFSGYHLSQAAEKLIKLYLLEEGLAPPKTHKIYELCNFMKNKGVFDAMFDEIRNMALEIDVWSSETRYNINPLAALDRLKHALKIITDIYEYENNVILKIPDIKTLDPDRR